MVHVVIAGGGFAGIRLARKLRNKKGITITLINETPDFKYCPALYRAATGYKVGTAHISLEWALLDAANVELVVGRVTGYNPASKQIKLEDGTVIDYSYLVLALGSVTTFFNIAGLHEHAYGVKTVSEIMALRRHLHDRVLDPKNPETNFVIVGAGPTGVEVAGGLGTYLQHIAYEHKLKHHRTAIWLVEAGPRILPQVSATDSVLVAKRLAKRGIKVLTNTTVKGETIHNLRTSGGNIETHTVIWTAGTANNPFYAEHKEHFELNQRGKVVVGKHLDVAENVYVIGDNAATKHAGLALTAIMHANFVARDIQARIKHRKRPNKYEMQPIQVVPIDNHWAVMRYGSISLHGRLIAWVRMAADYIGYSDVLGYIRALTIWTNRERYEDDCTICMRDS